MLVTNCAYRGINASIAAAQSSRDIWGNELDGVLSELAKEFCLDGCDAYTVFMGKGSGQDQDNIDPRKKAALE